MKLKSGRVKFHHFGWNHFFDDAFQKFIMLGACMSSICSIGYRVLTVERLTFTSP
jgi:hypothetical protein